MTRVEAIRELMRSGMRYAYALTRDRARAEDLLQDAWVRLLESDSSFDKPLLFRIIRNRFIDLQRRGKVIGMVPYENGVGGAQKSEPDFDIVVRADRKGLIRAMSTLRDDEREAVYLHVVEEYTAAEIAEMQGRTRSNILVILHRARKKLRDILDQPDSEAS